MLMTTDMPLPTSASPASSNELVLRLSAIGYGAQDINIYRFADIAGRALPPASPGAHIDLHISENFTRQYSLLRTGEDLNEYVIAVQHLENGRGGSALLHQASVVGELYRLSYPRNHFIQGELPKEVHLLAGGIGITPLLPLFSTLRDAGRDVTLYYWAQTEAHFLRDMALAHGAVHRFATREGGAVPSLTDILAGIPDTAAVCCCGPRRMMDVFEASTKSRPPHLLYRERFQPIENTGPGTSFTVQLRRSQKTLTVGPKETILQACLAAGVDVSYSCEEGVCGACVVKVHEGEVEHRDSAWLPVRHAQESTMMICCSRSAGGSLILDL